MKRVAADIVTGFLGSGKTTLIKSLLSRGMAGERVAVIVNELGDIGIDATVLRGAEYIEEMVELVGGCVCCTIDDCQFELAVEELVRLCDPTLIVIETTGVADPGPTMRRVRRAGLGLDAVITVVDARSAPLVLGWTKVARAQIKGADFIVVTKGDLVDDRTMARMRRRLSRINRRALVTMADHGDADFDTLFAAGLGRGRTSLTDEATYQDEKSEADSAAARSAVGKRPALAEPGVETFSHSFPGSVVRSRFESFLSSLPSSVWRAKGIVRFEDNPWSCIFNLTCGRYELDFVRLPKAGIENQAVFIGRNIGVLRSEIVRSMEASGSVSDALAAGGR